MVKFTVIIECESNDVSAIVEKLRSTDVAFDVHLQTVSDRPRELGRKKLVTLQLCAGDPDAFHSIESLMKKAGMERKQIRSAANDARKRKQLERKLINGASHYRITQRGMDTLTLHEEALHNDRQRRSFPDAGVFDPALSVVH